MKKIGFLIVLLLISVNVYAYDINYEKKDGKYILSIEENNEVFNYREAMEKYSLDEYMIYTINNKDYYFYLGQEISEYEYSEALENKEINDKCTYLKDNCIRVKTTEEVIDAMNKIYSLEMPQKYYLMYTSYEYEKLDFERIKKYFRDKYMSDEEKNLYNYDEYAYIKPLKLMFEYDKNVITIDKMSIKTNEEEITKVDAFLDAFLKEFEGKSDYEKIMGVYTYINNTAIYQTDAGYINFMDGQLSAYDVLIKHKAVCIGLATTFQLLMERLGIDSYIVDHVSSKSDTEYITTHTYNIVKLDNEWYIVDIPLDGSLNGLLKGMSGNYSLEDFKYYDIKIADENYLNAHKNLSKDFSFDYASLLDLTKEIDSNKKEEVKDKKEDTKKSYMLEYILIIGILAIILGVIYIFTRKK